MAEALDVDSDSSGTSLTRLGICEVCMNKQAKYTCPRCEVKSCCIGCLAIHKSELKCTGVRDIIQFIPLKNMTKLDLQNDYHFLEECARYVESRKKDLYMQYRGDKDDLPFSLSYLRSAATDRKITLKFLTTETKKHKENTTLYDKKNNTIFWRLEWVFANADDYTVYDEKCNENEKLFTLVNKYLNINSTELDDETNSALKFYQSKSISEIKILLECDCILVQNKRYYEMDIRKTLNQNFHRKYITEYPTLHVVFAGCEDHLELIDSDYDENKNDTNTFRKLQKRRAAESVVTDMKGLTINSKITRAVEGDSNTPSENLLFPKADSDDDDD